MNGSFKKYCQEINFNLDSRLENSILDEIIQEKIEENNLVKERIVFSIKFWSIPTKQELEYFIEKTKTFFAPYETIFKICFINKNLSNERIYDLLTFGFKYLFNLEINKIIKFKNVKFDINNDTFYINAFSNDSLEQAINNKENIEKILSFFQLENDLKIKINNLTTKLLIDEEENFAKNEIEKTKKIKQDIIKNNANSSTFNNKYNQRKYFQVSLQEFYQIEETNLVVTGEVFLIETIVTKTKLEIWNIYITDYQEAINAKMFIRNETKTTFPKIEKGDKVTIHGEKKVDYNGSIILQIKKIEKLETNNELLDKEPNKRIEFSARSSYSAMDGIASPIELLNHAKKMGHEAIAFVDFQNIQAYPDIYNYAHKVGVKPIYGSTFSLITKNNQIVKNIKKGKELKKEKYVVFDLETTSLSPRYGEIIEFGAIKMENNNIIETKQFFIKPKNKISSFTENLTGISQKMIDEEAKFDEKEGLIEIINFFEDATLVAHNAQFDMGFINEKINQYQLNKIDNQIIDTLALAKYLIPISNSYRLEIVSKKYHILYDATVAHRADYDATVLSKVWKEMLNNLDSKNIKTFEEIDLINENYLHEKKIPHDIAIYAKNQKGLKKLFKLVSISLTDNYFNGPKLFIEDLKKDDDILIAPVSINTKLIDLMFTGTNEEIDKEIDKWDFIGVPSPHLFSHLISRGNVTKDELLAMLKDLVIRAKHKNKIVIAIGDLRYLIKEDSIAHSVYIHTKGLEGRRHPLYKYNEENPDYPIQMYLNTKEMKEQFSFLNSSNLVEEIVVTNTNLLNKYFDNDIQVIKSKLYTPEFDDSAKKLEELVYKNAHEIYGEKLPKIVDERIKRELTPIINHGFSVVYWISHKLVAKSNKDGYLVGSRGSVGSSLIATLSKITEVNPLIPHYICQKCKYNEFVENSKTSSGFDLPDKDCPNCKLGLTKNGQTIPFETFLGFNADKVPDIDLNFSGIYQPIIHQEVKNLFGETHSFRAGTISTVATKTAYGFVRKWNEETNQNKSNSFITYLSTKVEGTKRTTGQHPGGIIIIPKNFDVEDFSPINYPANDISSSWKTTHFDFHAIHDNVLKLDLLGHDDPTMIKELQRLTNVDINQISFSDPKIIELFSSPNVLGINSEDINGEPTGVLGIPEFGTKFVRRMLTVAKPKTFNDLINLSGLSHGTDVWSGNAEELIKSGKTLNDVISCRDDIMVYLIKKGVESSFSFKIMEKVRKGMGLTSDEEKELINNNVEQWYIDSLKKIKYMFPKAHAIAYVMMAWRISWFKIYYPLEYYAAYFTVRTNVFDIDIAINSKHVVQKKLNELEKRSKSNDIKQKLSAKEEELIPLFEIINEMMARDIKIENIDLRKSKDYEWIINKETNTLIPPFIVLDGLGEAVAKKIVDARNERFFSSVEDFVKRTSVNKTILEKLTKLGVFNNLDDTDQMKLW